MSRLLTSGLTRGLSLSAAAALTALALAGCGSSDDTTSADASSSSSMSASADASSSTSASSDSGAESTPTSPSASTAPTVKAWCSKMNDFPSTDNAKTVADALDIIDEYVDGMQSFGYPTEMPADVKSQVSDMLDKLKSGMHEILADVDPSTSASSLKNRKDLAAKADKLFGQVDTTLSDDWVDKNC